MTISEKGCDVVIVNYNAGAILGDCMHSALSSSRVKKVVLVDNASADDSVRMVETRFRDDPRVIICKNDRNLGFAAANNKGMEHVSSDSVLFLNPDCIIEPEALDGLLAVLYSAGKVAMVGPRMLNEDGTEQEGTLRTTPTPANTLFRAFGLSFLARILPGIVPDYAVKQDSVTADIVPAEVISGACMLARTDAMREVGCWDEGYFLHVEDIDLCVSLRNAGWQILYASSVSVKHKKGVCSKSRPVFVEWHKHRGMARYFRKFYRDKGGILLIGLLDLGIWSRFAVIVLIRGLRNLMSSLRGRNER